jgi:hypothetical protein
MKKILSMSLMLISTIYETESTENVQSSGTNMPREQSQQMTFEDVKQLHATFESASHFRSKIIFALNGLMLKGSLKEADKVEAINIAKELGAENIAIRLEKYQENKDYGELNKLPEDIVKFILHSIGSNTNAQTLKNLLLVNKSFHAAMLTAPVSIDFSVPANYGKYDPVMEYYVSDYATNDAANDHAIEILVQVFPHIRELNLLQSKITDAGLSFLKEAKNLQSLNLLNCEHITAAGLKEVGSFTNIRSLNLSFLPVTSEILKDLGSLKKLENLAFRWGSFNDADLENLIPLKESLKRLGIPYCEKITNEGLAKFLQSMEIIALDLSNNSWVNDETLGHLNKQIKFLNLESTSITPQGLTLLIEKLDNMSVLRLDIFSDFESIFLELFKRFPHLEIYHLGKKLTAQKPYHN